MSAPITSESRGAEELSLFRRTAGLLRLTYGLLAGPVFVLWSELFSYHGVNWACGDGHLSAVHAIPIAFLVLTLLGLLIAYQDWTRTGGGTSAQHASLADRTRFVSLCGVILSAYSALIIAWMWVPLFVFTPCQH